MDSIVKIPIEQLYPHPDNPRKNLGDLSELADSIRAKGIMQNLTVVPACMARREGYTPPDGTYTVIIGHRRHAAAKLAGLTELPCVITEMDAREQMQTMLIENMQRSDLTKFEEAQGFQMMLDLGSPVEEIAEKTGFSETTVRRRLKWMEMDQEKFKKVTAERQISLGDLDRLSQIEDLGQRNECLDKIGTSEFDMAVQKAVKNQQIDAHLPEVQAWLKSVKAKKLQHSDRWNGKYDRACPTIYVEKWGEDGNKPDQIKPDKKVFYYIGEQGYDRGQLELYHEREKAPPVKRPPEEIEKEKAIAAAHQKLDEAASLAYDLRKRFVENLSVTKKNEPLVLLGAVYAGGFNAMNYNGADRAMLYRAIGLDPSESYIPDREQRFMDGIGRISGNDWAKYVYSLFGDDSAQTCGSGYKREFPEYKRSVKLELIYKWLTSLGYEMSTEEAQILSGDHEAFKAKAGESDGEM